MAGQSSPRPVQERNCGRSVHLRPIRTLPRSCPACLRAFRRPLVNIVLLVAIIVSGAVVRLTNSGLGCADWPNCSATKFVDVGSHHAAIEQVNRIFSGLIFIPLGLALLAAYWRAPRRRDLVALSWLLFGLFAGEAVLGGISVKVKLAWVSVSGSLPARDRAGCSRDDRSIAAPREETTNFRRVVPRLDRATSPESSSPERSGSCSSARS